jgi:LDH2 family malate/lactate/ureidoglycolate dehydrogenase
MLERFKVPEEDRVYVQHDRIKPVTQAILRHVGVDEQGAKSSSDVLMANDLRGNESHGVSNGLRRYVSEYNTGKLNGTPSFDIEHETSTTARVNANHALGTHVGPWAMDLAIEKAAKHGMGAVSVHSSGHLAGCGFYAMQAVEADMIGHCMTAGSSNQTVPPWGSKPLMGTNPIAYAAPAKTMPPFLFDVATTQVANNKIGLARRIGATVLPGWVTDKDGEPVLEEIPAPQTGDYHLLHIGGTRENGAHKGFGFALMNEIICNGFTGMGAGPVTGARHGGHFFMAFQIEAFTELEKFKTDMDDLLKHIAAVPPSAGYDRVVYAGLLEAEEEEKRLRDGIPYHREVIDWFESYCAEAGIDCDLR